ncbi:MAG: histidine phosphatase family protein [Caldicoprobacterales bacterium]|jgi:broad specificity phosphatase PhoE
MYIYLTRHGQTDWNAQKRTQGVHNSHLSRLGICQAEELAERLSSESISHLYSSPLDRAYQTAVIVGKKYGIIPEKREELQEINFGVWEGLTVNQIEKVYPGQLTRHRVDFTFAPENGESLQSLQRRICHFIEFIQRKHTDKDDKLLVTAHAYPIRMLIIELMRFACRHLWDFQLDNTGITIIHFESGKSRLICLNDTSHLSKGSYFNTSNQT